MCTSVIFFKKDSDWPVIIASNRDELLTRESQFPKRHWPIEYPNIVGGLDEKKNGTWLAINDSQIVAIIHNRRLEKKNDLEKISRGRIILEILKHENMENVLNSLKNLNHEKYEGFNILIADKNNCYWAKHVSADKKIEIFDIPEGISILTDTDLNNKKNKKINYYLKKFSQVSLPNPANDNWISWELIMSMDYIDNQKSINESICFYDKLNKFGTKSSAFIALPNIYGHKNIRILPIFKATKKSPKNDNYKNIDLF